MQFEISRRFSIAILTIISPFLFAPAGALCQGQAPAEALQPAHLTATVRIIAAGVRPDQIAEGAGFFIRRNLIATTYAVVKDGLSFKARLEDGQLIEATLVGVDPQRTVAILTTDHPGAAVLRVRYEHDLVAGDDLSVQGPAGNKTVTCRLGSDGQSIQPAEQIGISYSGSPVLNKWGEVVGLADISGQQGQMRLVPISALSEVGNIVTAGSKSEIQARKAASEADDALDSQGFGNRPESVGRPAPGNEQNPGGLPAGTLRFRRLAGADQAVLPPEAAQPPSVIRKTTNDLLKSVLRSAEPLYPRHAKTGNISGLVMVEVTIDWQGYVTQARALSGPKILRPPAIAAAMAHLFSPSFVDGQAVKVIGSLRFVFRAQPPGTPSGRVPIVQR